MNTFETVKATIVDVLCVDPFEVRPESVLSTDLGADSLDRVDVIMRVEREFGIMIPDEFEYSKVQDLVDFVDKKKAQS